jgi:hypothetical protein
MVICLILKSITLMQSVIVSDGIIIYLSCPYDDEEFLFERQDTETVEEREREGEREIDRKHVGLRNMVIKVMVYLCYASITNNRICGGLVFFCIWCG